MNTVLALVIAAIAATIAFMQWFLARQKFVLDLFDRRYRAYSDVVTAVRPIIAAGNASDTALADLRVFIQNSKFLFGSDVNDYLQELWLTAVQLQYWNTIYLSPDPEAIKSPEGMYKCNMKLHEFFKIYPKLCEGYMMMPEKRVRTIVEWWGDRNDLRKSYGDELQK